MPRKNPRLERYMIRPVIYKTSSRFLCALTAVLLWNEFVNMGGLWPRSRAFVFFGVLFAAAGWLAYLRVDGAHIPKLPKKFTRRRHDPLRAYGDLSEHVDDEITAFDDLDDDEQNLCLLLADVITAALFFVISLF